MKNSTSQTSGKNSKRTQRSAGALIVNAQNQLLLIFQSRGRFWEFPKGKVEGSEDDYETMLREVEEEVGITELAVIPGFEEEVQYEFQVGPEAVDKTVIYYAFRTTQEPQMSEEHLEYKWCSKKQALKLLRHDNFKNLTKTLFDVL